MPEIISKFESDSKTELGTMELEANEHIVSVDFKSSYTKDPVLEAIEAALRCFYSSDNPHNFEQSTLMLELKLAVANIHFKSKGD